MKKDKRRKPNARFKQFSNQAFMPEDGIVRHFDGKADMEKGELKVHRIMGSIQNGPAIVAGLEAFARSIGFTGALTHKPTPTFRHIFRV